MALRLDVPEMAAAGLVELLGDPHRSVHACTRLLTLGPAAAAAARCGLFSPDARVREQCCKVLDHLMDAESVPALIEALADPAAPVRIQAVHALACDRYKTDACRPAPEAVLPAAIARLTGDPSAHGRAYAAELVGRWVHRHRNTPPAARFTAAPSQRSQRCPSAPASAQNGPVPTAEPAGGRRAIMAA